VGVISCASIFTLPLIPSRQGRGKLKEQEQRAKDVNYIMLGLIIEVKEEL
jgi:hypothetical protein